MFWFVSNRSLNFSLKEIFKGCCCLLFSYQGSFLLFFSSDSFYILSKAFLFVKNFFNFFQSYLVAFQQQAYLYYHKLFHLSRFFSILFLCRFSRISLNSLSFSLSLVKNFFILFRHFSVVFQLVKIPFLNSVLNKRRRRDLNPRAATNDLLPFQGSPFNLLGTSAWLNLVSYSIYIRRQITKTRLQRRGWDSNPRALADKRFSRPPRYDHFDTSPNCLSLLLSQQCFASITLYFGFVNPFF